MLRIGSAHSPYVRGSRENNSSGEYAVRCVLHSGATSVEQLQKLTFVWLEKAENAKTLDCVVENDRAFGD